MQYLCDHQMPNKFTIFENASGVRTVAHCDTQEDADLVLNALNFYNKGD